DRPSLWHSDPLLNPDKDNFSLLNIAIHLIVSTPVSLFSGMSPLHAVLIFTADLGHQLFSQAPRFQPHGFVDCSFGLIQVVLCSMACGGKACKYENPSRWSDEEQAIKGLYSSWCGLKTVINLQRPGEHASCGYPLEQESGFTYRPEIFMEAGSVLFACYLVFTTRMNADQAILFVRAKRPNSIQTRGQLLCVREFAQFLVPLRSVFSCVEPKASAVTLSQYLTRQRHLLHGYEARQMKNVPKIVQLVCRLLVDIAANRQVVIEEEWLEIPDLTAEVEKTVSQQALQQLGKEMVGKGIPVLPCLSHTLNSAAQLTRPSCDQPLASDNELDPLWRQQNLGSPPRSLSKNRSLSDSLLNKHGLCLEHVENLSKPISCLMGYSLSHSNLTTCNQSSYCYLCTQNINSKAGAKQDLGMCVSHKRHHSLCSHLSELGKNSYFDATLPPFPLQNSFIASAECVDGGTGLGDALEAPHISLQSELSPENRRLMVAKALAMDLTDKDKEVMSKVLMWQSLVSQPFFCFSKLILSICYDLQTELNSREGTWERLCNERDPLVLSSLMWSWLEQLKDPVISHEDVQSLGGKNVNPQNALNSLEKVAV
ncbi:hypothetical protein GOODEAATRI_021242, partial [Goodea atripinnis]